MKRLKSRGDSISPERLKRAAMALEDLIFLLKHNRAENFLAVLDVVNELVEDSDSRKDSVVASYRSSDPNKHFLIGALPRLFLDRDLFPSNDDIVDFSNVALKIEIKAEKRARFEIIGKIVCETDLLDEKQLTDLVRALEKLVGNKETRNSMLEKRKAGSFSWNETIQELLRG
ncbi:hypothetical protein [Stenotrophomonas sp. A3_2]|jgi:hypothetical protein|uniref:hypothetical protein n=1 Tax=Stenotrophomonas sp. A3_2 TaxID=3119978 RepID=UPI002FC283FB